MSESFSTWAEIRRHDTSYVPTLVASLGFHLLVFLVIPLATKILWRPKQYARPQTFQLVTMPSPKPEPKAEPTPTRARPKPEPEPKPVVRKTVAKKPAVKKEAPAKPKPKPEPAPEEDLSELEELLGGMAPPAAQIKAAPGIQDWYINQMRGKIERNWRPPVRDPSLAVEVSFSVHANGTASDIQVRRASGSVSLDNAALRAVKLAAPFGKLPPNYRDNRLDVNITLIPVSR